MPVANEYDKWAVMQISRVLGQVSHIASWNILWNGTFRHLSDYIFRVCNLENKKCMSVIFFSKCLKFNPDFRNAAKNSEKLFYFWDNCFWIGIVRLSLLRTGYFSSIANVLTSSPKILHVNKRDLSNSIHLALVNEFGKESVMQISTMLGQVYQVACRRVFWNRTF